MISTTVPGQNTRDLKDVDNRVTQKLNMLFSGIAETSRNIGSIERRGVAAQAATADTITKLKSFETSLLSRENYRSLAEKSVQFRLGEKILTPPISGNLGRICRKHSKGSELLNSSRG